MAQLTPDQARLARVAAQGIGAATTTVRAAVHQVVGLQAQDPRATRLAVRVRTRGLTAADVDAAVRARAVVRTWAMRGTLHLVDAADLGWITSALGQHFAARGAPRRRQLGLDDRTLDRARDAFATILREPIPRATVLARLAEHGVVLDPRSQQAPHLLAWAANTGLVCRGPDGPGDEPTYVLVRDWLGTHPEADQPRADQPELDRTAALARLAERYLRGYGPATAEDFAAWSGLPLRTARTALGTGAWSGPVPAPDGRPRLLGHFDAYLLGYRGRDLAVPAHLAPRVQTGGGFVMPTVLVDGQVVGTWRLRGNDVQIETDRKFFGDIGNDLEDLGRFLGVRAPLVASTG